MIAEYTVTEADIIDLASLSTVVARSFHPVNPYIKNVFPDTAVMRAWWSEVFHSEISRSQTANLLVARDEAGGDIVGLLSLRLMDAWERGSGMWTDCTLTSDHDASAYKPMTDGMTAHRERCMLGKKHFLVQLFGVDHSYQGRHLGQKLLARACEIADRAGCEMFVQANGSAKGFYSKVGFELKAEEIMPGSDYREYMMVRPCKLEQRSDSY